MFPGYVTIYRDKDGFIHLYFFPGIENGKYIYKNLKLQSSKISYKETKLFDGAVDYKFDSKKIIKIICKLVDDFNEEHINILTI